MKKLLLSLISILTLSIFSACNSDIEEFRDEAVTTNITGILEEIESSDNLNGTHKLVTKNDDVIALRSLNIKLGSKQYLGNEVTVSGLMNDEDLVFEVTNGIKVDKVLSEQSYKGEFISYKNLDLGFQLKYYDDWSLVEGATEVAFYSPSHDNEELLNIDHVKISAHPFEYMNMITEDSTEEEILANNPLIVYYNENYPDDRKYDDLINLSSELHKIGTDQIDSLKFEYVNGKTEFITHRPGFIYKITYLPGEDMNERVFYEMLLEFSFSATEVDDIDSPILELDTVVEDPYLEDNSIEIATDNETLYETTDTYHDYIIFESSLYSFSALMPDDWYYAGSISANPTVLHHYAFSDDPIEEDLSNEILGLDIISDSIPTGETIISGDVELTGVLTGETYNIYTSVGENTFRLYAVNSKELYDVLVTMASSIASISE